MNKDEKNVIKRKGMKKTIKMVRVTWREITKKRNGRRGQGRRKRGSKRSRKGGVTNENAKGIENPRKIYHLRKIRE